MALRTLAVARFLAVIVAAGIPAFYTPTGASTAVEEGTIPIRYNPGGMQAGVLIHGQSKESRLINGRKYVLEPAIAGDVCIIRAWKVDEVGNCVFRYLLFTFVRYAVCEKQRSRYTANNFSAVMAKNAAMTIVEV